MASKLRKQVRKLHRDLDAMVGKALGGKPIGEIQSKAADHPLSIQNFEEYTYSKKSHFGNFLSAPMYANQTLLTTDLKTYQDLFMLTFIRNNIEPGSRLLEIGGGESRLIAWLKNDYEIWNLDKLEGEGFGPKNLGKISGFNLVKDYIGSFNPDLPDNYFDLVFSISTVEHFPEDESNVSNCIADIDRLLTHRGLSVHCVDAILHRDFLSVHPLVRRISLENNSVIVNLDFDTISQDRNLWCLPPFAYYTRWFPLTKRRLKQFGRPFSMNILWQKQ